MSEEKRFKITVPDAKDIVAFATNSQARLTECRAAALAAGEIRDAHERAERLAVAVDTLERAWGDMWTDGIGINNLAWSDAMDKVASKLDKTADQVAESPEQLRNRVADIVAEEIKPLVVYRFLKGFAWGFSSAIALVLCGAGGFYAAGAGQRHDLIPVQYVCTPLSPEPLIPPSGPQ